MSWAVAAGVLLGLAGRPVTGLERRQVFDLQPAHAKVTEHQLIERECGYDTYTAPDHQLCCAHALRELQAVTDAAPQGQWCWAAQAAGALTAMQQLVSQAIGQGRDAVDPDALAAQIRLFRSAALIGASQTAAPGR
jgi:hypothetical protein